jgi:hypothetical protein
MIVLVSRGEDRATFSWLNEILPPDRLLHILRYRDQASQRVRVNLKPSYDLPSSRQEIVRFLSKHKHALLSWLEITANARAVSQLYFDLHAALDALIDCLGVIHSEDRDPEMLSHKHTYTMILVFMAYQALYIVASRADVESYGPTTTTIIAIQQRCRNVLAKLVREPYLTQVEQSNEPFSIVPAALAPFWPAVPRFAIVFRDALRVLAPLLAPWRDFAHEMSGLAAFVLDHRTGAELKTRDESGA